jgi:hypothetical protein
MRVGIGNRERMSPGKETIDKERDTLIPAASRGEWLAGGFRGGGFPPPSEIFI